MGFHKLALAAAGALAAYFVISYIVSSRAASKIKQENGCKPPPQCAQSERIIGYSLLKESRAATAEKRLLETGTRRAAATGNTYSATLMGRKYIITIDPENIKALLATNFKDFGLGKRIHIFGPLLGSGIFTSDGEHWEHSRALVRPNLTKAQVASLDTFETHIQHLIGKIPRDGSTVDLQPLFFNMTLDSATEFLFGESVGSQLSSNGSEAAKFGNAFDYAQAQLLGRHRMGLLGEIIPNVQFAAACKTVHDFCDRYVAQTLKVREAEEKTRVQSTADKSDEGSKERYIFLNEVAKVTKDPRQLRDEMLNLLLAGRDTTASLLSNTFHALARNPRIWEKLKAEVDALEGKLPDYECLKNMQYLKWVLNEALRLYPAVPNNARYAKVNTVLPRGGGADGSAPVFIAKDSAVLYSVYTMHRRRDIYGDDADKFSPERWSSDAPGGPLRPGWGYLPFNGGPRVCVGQQYALTEAGYTIVRLLQTFSSIENRDPEPWKEGLGLTLCSGNGTKVALLRA